MDLHNKVNRAIGLVLLSPFILILLVYQVIWLPAICILGVVTLPFVAGMALWAGDSLSTILEPLGDIVFAPLRFIKLMLEIK